MSVFRWKYDETCEGRYCCGDCDKCDKEDEEVDDLISRQAAIEALGDMPMSWADTDAEIQAQEDWKQHREALLNLPTADLSEYSDKLWKTAYERGKAEAHSRTGKWVYDEERGARGIYAICTACNEMIYQTGGFNYCPNCGARMEEDDMR